MSESPSQPPSQRTIEQLAEAILAWEQSSSPDRDQQVDALVRELIHALNAQRFTTGELRRERADLIDRVIAAYTAIHGV